MGCEWMDAERRIMAKIWHRIPRERIGGNFDVVVTMFDISILFDII